MDLEIDWGVWRTDRAERIVRAVRETFGPGARMGVKNRALHVDLGTRYPGVLWVESRRANQAMITALRSAWRDNPAGDSGTAATASGFISSAACNSLTD